MTDEKWRSPTGHSIASDVTDKLPPKGEVMQDDVQAALDALSDMNGRTFSNLLQLGVPKDAPVYSNLRKETEIIKRALERQQPDTELLVALKGIKSEFERQKQLVMERMRDAIYLDGVLAVISSRADEAIARAEQKGQNHELIETLDRMIETPAPQDAPMLTGDIKVGVTTFRQGVKLSTVQACIDSHINSMPKTAPQGWKLVPIEQIKALETLADAYEDADECDYCSDAYPEHEGCRPDELARKFVRQARLLSAAPTPAQPEKLDVEALKREAWKSAGSPSFAQRIVSDAIDHLAEHYDFVRKV